MEGPWEVNPWGEPLVGAAHPAPSPHLTRLPRPTTLPHPTEEATTLPTEEAITHPTVEAIIFRNATHRHRTEATGTTPKSMLPATAILAALRIIPTTTTIVSHKNFQLKMDAVWGNATQIDNYHGILCHKVQE